VADTNLRIDLAAEFKGAKAFREADTAVGKLNNSVNTLAKTLGITLGARALYNFGKASVKAFTDDQKAATQLTNTLKNLGLELSAPSMNKFIEQMTIATGVTDDELRPALQSLLQVTGSITKSQNLLTQALDASASTGIDLKTVSFDLGQAYVGNLKGLRKYNLGLTQAELKTKSFTEIQGLFNDKFGGALQASLSTTAGKIQVLTNAAGQAQEKIGGGLVDAFARISGGTETKDAVKTIDNIATSINAVTLAVGTLVGGLVKLYGIFDKISTLGGLLGANGTLFGNNKRMSQNGSGAYVGGLSGTVGSALSQGRAIAEAKAEKDALARQKAITAELTKQSKVQKEKLALTKASAVLTQANKLFDNEQIQLAAALQGKLSEEDKVRVKLKQDILGLEEAIQTNNVQAAASFSNAIVQDSDKLRILRGDLNSFSDVPNPFDAWLETIRQMAAELAKLANMPILGSSSTYASRGGNNIADYGGAAYQAPVNPYAGTYYGATGRDPMPVANVTVVLDNKAVGGAVRDAFLSDSLSGSQSSIARGVGTFSV
jgi:hypothetical protein